VTSRSGLRIVDESFSPEPDEAVAAFLEALEAMKAAWGLVDMPDSEVLAGMAQAALRRESSKGQ